jgi:hypothetical protein
VCRRSENGCVTDPLGPPDALSSLNSIEAVDSSQGRPVSRMDGAHCGPLPIERLLSRAVQRSFRDAPSRREKREATFCWSCWTPCQESGRTGVRAGVADSAWTPRRSSEDRCLDVVRTGRRQRAACERRQAVRGPGTVVTALRKTRCDREYRNARTSAPGVVAGLAPRAYRVLPGRPLLSRASMPSSGLSHEPRGDRAPGAPYTCLKCQSTT